VTRGTSYTTTGAQKPRAGALTHPPPPPPPTPVVGISNHGPRPPRRRVVAMPMIPHLPDSVPARDRVGKTRRAVGHERKSACRRLPRIADRTSRGGPTATVAPRHHPRPNGAQGHATRSIRPSTTTCPDRNRNPRNSGAKGWRGRPESGFVRGSLPLDRFSFLCVYPGHGPAVRRTCSEISMSYGRVWFGFFLTSLSEKLAVGKSWLLGKAGG
jgi:hypothetical protein